MHDGDLSEYLAQYDVLVRYAVDRHAIPFDAADTLVFDVLVASLRHVESISALPALLRGVIGTMDRTAVGTTLAESEAIRFHVRHRDCTSPLL